jgi:hypothetical protein
VRSYAATGRPITCLDQYLACRTYLLMYPSHMYSCVASEIGIAGHSPIPKIGIARISAMIYPIIRVPESYTPSSNRTLHLNSCTDSTGSLCRHRLSESDSGPLRQRSMRLHDSGRAAVVCSSVAFPVLSSARILVGAPRAVGPSAAISASCKNFQPRKRL